MQLRVASGETFNVKFRMFDRIFQSGDRLSLARLYLLSVLEINNPSSRLTFHICMNSVYSSLSGFYPTGRPTIRRLLTVPFLIEGHALNIELVPSGEDQGSPSGCLMQAVALLIRNATLQAENQ
jgi:hypothetical protein